MDTLIQSQVAPKTLTAVSTFNVSMHSVTPLADTALSVAVPYGTFWDFSAVIIMQAGATGIDAQVEVTGPVDAVANLTIEAPAVGGSTNVGVLSTAPLAINTLVAAGLPIAGTPSAIVIRGTIFCWNVAGNIGITFRQNTASGTNIIRLAGSSIRLTQMPIGLPTGVNATTNTTAYEQQVKFGQNSGTGIVTMLYGKGTGNGPSASQVTYIRTGTSLETLRDAADTVFSSGGATKGSLPTGLATDGSGGLLAWIQSDTPKLYRQPSGSTVWTLVPSLNTGSWSYLATALAISDTWLGADGLVYAMWSDSNLNYIGFMFCNPADYSTWTQVLLQTITPHQVEFRPLRVNANQFLAVGRDASNVNPWQVQQRFPGAGGPAVTGITSTSADFTVTFSAAHGITAGKFLYLRGFTPAAYNGLWTVASVAGLTVTVTSAANPGVSTVQGAWHVWTGSTATNISLGTSTSPVGFDTVSATVCDLWVFQRTSGILYRTQFNPANVWDNPTGWPSSGIGTAVAQASTKNGDGGYPNAIVLGTQALVGIYSSGISTEANIKLLLLPQNLT